MLTQGKPQSRRQALRLACGLAWPALASLAAARAGAAEQGWGDRPGAAGPPQALAPGLWWWPGAPGEADALNRGQVSAVLLAAQGQRLWLLGSGPSPAFGRQLRAQVLQQLGRPVSDVISPWARPEAVLGQAALGPARRWAHQSVAQAMQRQCERCEARLRQRLGAAAVDLGPSPVVRLPDHPLSGEHGSLGPWQWWRLWRAADSPVTLWRWRQAPWWSAPGLLWADGPPDLRDADLPSFQASLAWLARLSAADGVEARFLPEQGPVMDRDGLAETQAYLRGLAQAVSQALAAGGLASDPPSPWAGLPPRLAEHPRHAMNWQRVWRQLEDASLSAGA